MDVDSEAIKTSVILHGDNGENCEGYDGTEHGEEILIGGGRWMVYMVVSASVAAIRLDCTWANYWSGL